MKPAHVSHVPLAAVAEDVVTVEAAAVTVEAAVAMVAAGDTAEAVAMGANGAAINKNLKSGHVCDRFFIAGRAANEYRFCISHFKITRLV